MRDQHTELGAPVSDVVNSHHIVTTELKYAAQSVSNDGRSQVTNVHLLRDIGGRKIYQNFLLRNAWRADALGQCLRQRGHNGTIGDVDINESVRLEITVRFIYLLL